MDVQVVLRLLRERWKSIVIVTLFVTLLGGFVTWRQTPVYSSQVTLFVSAWTDSSDVSSAYMGNLASQQRVKSYIALMRGPRVATAVRDQLGLDMSPSAVGEKIRTAAVPQTVLLTATVVDPSPARARDIANAVAAQFIKLVPRLETSSGGKGQPVRVSVVDPATLPTTPISPRPRRNLAFALMVGLLGGCCLAVARHALDTTVKSVEQATEIAEAASLGAIVADPNVPQSPLIIDDGPYAPRAEAFRKIRTGLQFTNVDSEHKVVLVTSSVPGEGKSTIACNLAITLAQSGKRVLLIDADLRRPRAGQYLGLPSGVGLTSVLVGTATLEDAVQVWGDDLVYVLASGPVPPNPSEILGSRHMRELLDRLGTEYDMVIIDAPPVLPVTDAAATAAACDGVVMVVGHGRVTRDQLRAAISALRMVDAKVLGTVLNLVPDRGEQAYREYGARPEDGAPQFTPTGWLRQPAGGQRAGRAETRVRS
jgi:capsular exopolysaccharide synthesis family protein